MSKTPDLRGFRSQISKLKKAGLLSKSVDARSVKPTPYLRSQVLKYKNVLNGNQTTVKVSKPQAKAAKQMKRPVKGDRVIVDRIPGQRIRRSKADPMGFHRELPNGVIEIEYPGIASEHVHQYLQQIEGVLRRKYPQKHYRLGFRFFGNASHQVFSDMAQIRAKFRQYMREQLPKNPDEWTPNITVYLIPNEREAAKWRNLRRKKK